MVEMLTLSEFMTQLVASATNANIKIPSTMDSRWHRLLFDLKSVEAGYVPACIDELCFDFDGPVPKCQKADRALTGLVFSGIMYHDFDSCGQLKMNRSVARSLNLERYKLNGKDTTYIENTMKLITKKRYFE